METEYMAKPLRRAKRLEASHLRMARTGLNMTVRELAGLADMNKATIVRIEAGYPVRETSLNAVRDTLESKGARFFVHEDMRGVLVSIPES